MEIEGLNLEDGEEEKLLQRRKLLLEGSRVIETLSKITSIINIDNGIGELSGIAQREISRLETLQNGDIISIDNELININDSLSKISTLIEKVQDQIGVDNDEWAFNNANENLILNNISNIKFINGTPQELSANTFDIVLVNIIKFPPLILKTYCRSKVIQM